MARALIAEHSAYATQAIELSGQAVRGQRLDFSLAATRVERAAASNSADALIFWLDCSQVAELSAGELNRLVADGVDGFVCMAGRLRTMAGSPTSPGTSTPASTAPPTGSSAGYADRRS